MRGNELLDKMEFVDPEFLEKAEMHPLKKRSKLLKWCVVAACLCFVFIFGIPVMAATIPAFYNSLYVISPSTAQFFKPIKLSCEDNGIRMEVLAIYIHQDTAEIYISMQDLEENRIDETIDLFDSYQINTPFDCTSNCLLSSYDSQTQTATFLITIEQWDNQNIIGDKLTFSVGEFLHQKKTYLGIIDGVNLGNVMLNPETQFVEPRGLGGTLFEKYDNTINSKMSVLKADDIITSPVNGVSIVGIGFIDDTLHVQVYYEDIGKTDNHGFLSLINKSTQEIVEAESTISFFDDEKKVVIQSIFLLELQQKCLKIMTYMESLSLQQGL